jgi:HD-GYP domain-containing protein (c-di-GMP phosphodiesterase class II)
MVHGGIEPSAAAAVLHHHQRFDGSGFPALVNNDGSVTRLDGTKIHVFGRIIFAADLYDHMANPGTGKRRSNLEVLGLLNTQYAHLLDPEVRKAMAAVAPPFPPGTKVRLEDGTIAVVTGVNPEDPYKPTVKRMMQDGKGVEQKAIAKAAVASVAA